MLSQFWNLFFLTWRRFKKICFTTVIYLFYLQPKCFLITAEESCYLWYPKILQNSFLQQHHTGCHNLLLSKDHYKGSRMLEIERGFLYPIAAGVQISCREICIKSIQQVLKMHLYFSRNICEKRLICFNNLSGKVDGKQATFPFSNYSSTVESLLWKQPIFMCIIMFALLPWREIFSSFNQEKMSV